MRVFLCHASEDKPRVRELCQLLRRDGFEPWLDAEQLLPGQDWEFEISSAVQSSDVVLVCLSSISVGKTGYVQKELKRVLEAAEYRPEGRIFVIPVRLDDCPVPNRLNQWQYADLFASGGYERLFSALQSRAEGRDGAPARASANQPDSHPPGLPPAKPVRKRAIVTASAVLVLAVCASGIYMKFRTQPARSLALQVQPQDPVPPGMVRISGGRFLMGRNGFRDSTTSPAHEVTVEAFYLDAAPVTNARYRLFLQTARSVPDRKPTGASDWPVTEVTWDDADAYCLSLQKRLPTEAEWEFAARGADGRLYPWGEVFNAEAANYEGSKIGHPETVASRALNLSPFGAADMSGNVWQWCADDYGAYPGGVSGFPIPKGAKVLRGGSYQSDAWHVTSLTRNLELPSKRSRAIGFRCAK